MTSPIIPWIGGKRRLADRLGIHKSSGSRALKVLVERGFLDIVVPGGFSCKVKRATEYRLTAQKCDVTGDVSSKKFMRWGLAKNKTRSQQKPRLVASGAHKPSY